MVTLHNPTILVISTRLDVNDILYMGKKTSVTMKLEHFCHLKYKNVKTFTSCDQCISTPILKMENVDPHGFQLPFGYKAGPTSRIVHRMGSAHLGHMP